MSQVIALLLFRTERQANKHHINVRRRQRQADSIRSEEIGLRAWIHGSDEITNPFEGYDFAIVLRVAFGAEGIEQLIELFVE